MVAPRIHGNCRPPGSQIDSAGRSGGLVVADIGGAAIAQTAIVTKAPATDAVVIQDGTGVICRAFDREGGTSGSKVDRLRGWAVVIGVARVAVDAAIARTLAADRVIIEDRTRVVVTAGYL